jgi:hypothetical protein
MFRQSLAKHVRSRSPTTFIITHYLQSVPAELVALTCDTTGTLIASHYVNPNTKIACIFGTGCNAAYMEKIGNIPKLAGLNLDPEAEIAINCEWVSLPLVPCVSFLDTNHVEFRVLLIPLSTSICLVASMTLV